MGKAWWSVWALGFVASCGGSSESHGPESGGGDGGSGLSSSGGSAANAGNLGSGGAGATSGVNGRGGASGSAGAGPVEPPGPVFCGGVECPAPGVCCMATGHCFDPSSQPSVCAPPDPDNDPEGRRPCAANSHCADGEFCMADSAQLCRGQGHCQPIDNCGTCGGDPGVCTTCGCDGNTYPDLQTACRAGANPLPYHGGGCGDPITIGGAGSGGAATQITPCGHDAHCASTERCCDITGLCYPSSDAGRCQVPPDGTRFPCTSNTDCYGAEYCVGAGCEGPGGCVQRDTEECGVTLEPVCGCDGTTYTSAACASSRGVRVAANGECAGE